MHFFFKPPKPLRWNHFGSTGLSKGDAMTEYVALVEKLKEKYGI